MNITPKLVKYSSNNYEEYQIDGNKNDSVMQYLQTITPSLTTLISEKKNNIHKYNIVFLIMYLNFIDDTNETYIYDISSDTKNIKIEIPTTKIITTPIKTIQENFYKLLVGMSKLKFHNLAFSYIIFYEVDD